MSQQPISPPPIPLSPDPAVGGSVRRSHTISSSSRRTSSRTTDHSEADEWNEHDVVGEDWVGGVGTIGEKNSSLHRQASLPSKYNRPIRPHGSRSATLTPSRTVGGLSSHMDAGYDEGDWELDIRRTQEEVNTEYQQSQQQQELNEEEQTQESTPYGASSSTQAAVRRYHSVTYGHAPKRATPSLQRAGTTTTRRSQTTNAALEAPDDEDKYAGQYTQDDGQEFEEPGSFHGHDDGQQLYGNASAGNSWQGGNDSWRAGNQGDWRSANQMEDLSRAMGGMDLQQQGQPTQSNYAHGGPRFNPNARQASPNLQQQQYIDGSQQQQQGRNLRLYTDVNQPLNHGPVSASAYVPPIGHGPGGQRPERTIGGRASNPNLAQTFNDPYGGNQSYNNMPPPPPIPAQYLNQVGMQHSGRLNSVSGSAFAQHGNSGVVGIGPPPQPVALQPGNPATYLSSPIDVPTMIAHKGYNPATFDTKPPFARYFVIKSYTEDDVHKSLKYEIWSSTDPGNKRLDKAFKECAGRGPIYLFFSVNASGHFCGMAEMLTPVDYTRSSTVWASDKWKGVFKVRWIFVRDIPNAVLRNIRLNNTQERKPVTNSRDTQELLPEAGHEMLRIFFTHPARTSLLQDFAFYELQSMQRQQQQAQQQAQQPGSGAQSPQPGAASPLQHPYAMPNPHAVPYPNMMPPMMQGGGYAPAPSVIQGVLRGASPAPPMAPNPAYGGLASGNGNGF